MAVAGARPMARIVVVGIVAVLLGFQVIRTAAVADREEQGELASTLWPSHPSVLTDRALLSIATAAAAGKQVPATTRADVRRVAAKAPLSPDPFLVEGAIAETEGRSGAAEQLLVAARSRDPRSRGTRFLLAERYFRTGRVTDALVEMQALVGLQSRGLEVFIPALVGYARTPGAVPALRAYFVRFPRLEADVLSLLARDPANADLVLSLATVRKPVPDWRGNLVSALAASGQYAKAYAIWQRLSGVNSSPGLFNPGFAELAAPPPFNWQFNQTPEGVAEPDGKGGLSVLYYGRAKTVFGSQLLLLAPGSYRLATQADGASGEPGAIHWALRCANTDKVLADMPLHQSATAADFTVPAECPAQWLELVGIAADMPQTSELTIRDMRLAAGTAR
jgi:hypothetical protein